MPYELDHIAFKLMHNLYALKTSCTFTQTCVNHFCPSYLQSFPLMMYLNYFSWYSLPPVFPPDDVSSYPLPQPGTVRVTWTQAPNSTHGLTLMGYSVQYRVEGGDRYQSQQVTDTPSLGELETFELEGLELGTTYEIRVAMVTPSGVGKYSDVINVTTYAGMPFSPFI